MGGKGLRASPNPRKEVTELGGPWPHPTCSPIMQRYSLVRDKCFLSATECLQKIM